MSEKIIQLNEEAIKGELGEMVRPSVEDTLNTLLDEEADRLTNASRYERTEGRKDTRAGSYRRKLLAKAGEAELKVPRLQALPFETAIIERYKRREISVEEALVDMDLAGVSVRRVEDIPEALWRTRVSAGTVSKLNKKAAMEKAKLVVNKLKEMKLTEAAKKGENAVAETLPYRDFPSQHWLKIRRNNSIERLNREIRRRTRVVGAFPDGKSALMLVCARLRYMEDSRWGCKQYLNMKHLEAQKVESLFTEEGGAVS